MKTFRLVLKTLLWGWAPAAKELFQIVRRLIAQWCHQEKLGIKTTPNRCVPINDPAFVRPDPLIYDQYFLTSLGLAVTWDNPDIQLYLNGVPVSSNDLVAATTYEIVAQVWNNSPEAPVVALPVAFSFLEFGVGTISVPIGSTQIDLGVKGGQNCPAFARMMWTTPAVPGHYCIQVQLEPADDSNTQNNLGQENTNVGTAHSPAVFAFTLRNDTQRPQSYKFAVDAYTPGTPDPCGSAANTELARKARLARHKRGAQPLPAGWLVDINPVDPLLSPGQSTQVTVTATPPGGFLGNQIMNVHAFHKEGLAGGVTLTVDVV